MNRKMAIAPLRLALLLACLVFATACSSSAQDGSIWPTGGWPVSTPEEQDMDPSRLAQMMALIDGQGFAYDSVLVVRHGTIVFEEYRNGYDKDTKHHLQSTTKSFSSMLIGIALHEGFLSSVDQKLTDLFPNHSIANMDARKQRLTLEHLLTMSDGMDWHEVDYPYTDTRNTLGQMWASADAVQHVLDRPMAREPGEAWAYNSGTSILLGGILEEATGRDVLGFAYEYLFEPLGIEDFFWSMTTGGHYHTDGGLYLTPRDMARFGYLMLHGGTWDGHEIVSPEWVQASTETHYQASAGHGYGYQWWTLDGGIFAAHGHHEQNIFVVPEADLVVVLTGNIPDDVIPPSNGLLFRYILPACTDLPPEATHHTYADYGFSFAYPTGFTVQEMPLPGSETPSPEAGMVQFQLLSYPLELVEIIWLQVEPDPDLNAHLAGFNESAAQQAGVTFTVAESRPFAQGSHRGIYQSFDFEQQGLQLRGANVIWYCSEAGRIYILSYVTHPEVSDQDLAAGLQAHLNSMACHDAP